MQRREFITLLGGAAVGWPLAARAQQPGKLPLVGVLVSASPPHPFADALRRGLQILGYSEGRNIALEPFTSRELRGTGAVICNAER
jgi:putative ABC transport system substrate-binding protein